MRAGKLKLVVLPLWSVDVYGELAVLASSKNPDRRCGSPIGHGAIDLLWTQGLAFRSKRGKKKKRKRREERSSGTVSIGEDGEREDGGRAPRHLRAGRRRAHGLNVPGRPP